MQLTSLWVANPHYSPRYFHIHNTDFADVYISNVHSNLVTATVSMSKRLNVMSPVTSLWHIRARLIRDRFISTLYIPAQITEREHSRRYSMLLQ